MRTIKTGDLITLSFDRTKLILFQPFLIKKWLKLLFIAVLAGAISSGGFSGSSSRSQKKAEADEQTVSTAADSPAVAVSTNRYRERPDRSSQEFKQMVNNLRVKFAGYPPVTIFVVALLAVVLLTGLIMLFAWLGSCFKFVWLHAIIHNDTAIKAPFKEYRKEGNSIFKLSLVVGLLFLVVMGLFALSIVGCIAGAGYFKENVTLTAGAITGLVGVVVIFLAVIVFAAIWNVYVEHFVVPIMMLDRQTYLPSWDKFSVIYKNNRGDMWLYLAIILGLGIVCSILEGIAFLAVLVLGIILAAFLYGVGYLVFAVLLKAKILFFGFLIGAGIPLVVVFVIAILLTVLPCAVFFRSFSLYFFSSLNEGYAPLPLGGQSEVVT